MMLLCCGCFQFVSKWAFRSVSLNNVNCGWQSKRQIVSYYPIVEMTSSTNYWLGRNRVGISAGHNSVEEMLRKWFQFWTMAGRKLVNYCCHFYDLWCGWLRACWVEWSANWAWPWLEFKCKNNPYRRYFEISLSNKLSAFWINWFNLNLKVSDVLNVFPE